MTFICKCPVISLYIYIYYMYCNPKIIRYPRCPYSMLCFKIENFSQSVNAKYVSISNPAHVIFGGPMK